MEKQLDVLLYLLNVLIGRISTDNSVDINPVTGIAKDDGFFLYVGTEGVVVGTTFAGKPVNRKFIVGYHPIKMKFIDTVANGTTATDMAACY